MVKTATKKRKQGGKRSRRRMTLRRGGNPHYDEETLNHVRAYIDNLTAVTPSKKAVLKANLETLPYDPNYIFFTPGVADPTNKKQQARDRINLALYGIVWFPSVSFPMNYPPQTMEKLTQFLLEEHRRLLTQNQTPFNIRRMDLVDEMLAHLNELPYESEYEFNFIYVLELAQTNIDEEFNETSPTRGYYQGRDRLHYVMFYGGDPWFQLEEQSDEESSNESSPSPSSSEASSSSSSNNGWVNRLTNFVNGSPSDSEPEDDDPFARLANNPHSPSDSEPEDDDPFGRLANNPPSRSPSPSPTGSEDEADDDERFRKPDLIYDNVVPEILGKYEMNENEYPENIQSLDFITGDLQPFNDAVRGDGVPLYDNIVFTLDGSNFVAVSRTRMINALTDNGNYLRFECEGQNNRQRKDDIPYALTGGVIGIPAGVVPLAQLKYVIENNHIALVYLEDANRTIEFMGSPDNFGEHIFSGAHHCQEGTNQKVYNLNEVEIIKITGGRRRHRKRKTLRKQPPRRLRHRKTSKK